MVLGGHCQLSGQMLLPSLTTWIFHFPPRLLPVPGSPHPLGVWELSAVMEEDGLQPGQGAPDPQGFLQASLGPQGLWWPLLSNLGRGQDRESTSP